MSDAVNTVSEYLGNMTKIQENILSFIDNEDDNEENYQNIIKLFDDQKILNNPFEMKLILLLISKISNNHYRTLDFFSKIERVLLYFKDSMKENFSNNEIFAFFSGNKRILLFLFKEKIINFDFVIFNNIKGQTMKNLKYFLPEFNLFLKSIKTQGMSLKKIKEK